MITVYGIPNCSSVKKTRAWLDSHSIDYVFHDFKKQGIDESTIKSWLSHVPLTVLVNRKGTTWRGLSSEQQAMSQDEHSAIELMMQNSSVIKRPVLVFDSGVIVGHDEEALARL
ncbi:arsenate reductase [Hydromonas duriensis]|uniref:Arsenate reductase n=1 Tax=Hydromonas duriensis TaxID=1527608 RepID=A0A4R6Y9W0_9BURK|nr:arsenate reductase [Hydromonas duriensis]TDR32291.1 arsenate reductase [Hydromonas duriensis]